MCFLTKGPETPVDPFFGQIDVTLRRRRRDEDDPWTMRQTPHIQQHRWPVLIVTVTSDSNFECDDQSKKTTDELSGLTFP